MGNIEFRNEEFNGLFFKPENESELIKKIKFLLDNPTFAKELGNNLYQDVLHLADTNSWFENNISIYCYLHKIFHTLTFELN